VQHLKRTHPEEAIESALAFSSITNGNGVVAASPNEDSWMASESGESAINEMETTESKASDKASLIAKLRELQAFKEESMAKFDGDIAALKRVLSFM
jgi:hypothetical protein